MLKNEGWSWELVTEIEARARQEQRMKDGRT